jgi:hypothetical protein
MLDNLGNFKKGVPHGYFRYFDVSGDLEFFGCFVRGIGHGVCWKGRFRAQTTFRNICKSSRSLKVFTVFRISWRRIFGVSFLGLYE